MLYDGTEQEGSRIVKLRIVVDSVGVIVIYIVVIRNIRIVIRFICIVLMGINILSKSKVIQMCDD